MDATKILKFWQTKFPEFLISNLIISAFFIFFKICILLVSGTNTFFFPGYFFFDFLTATLLSSLIFFNKSFFNILTDLLINFYVANIIYIFFFGSYIDRVTFVLFSEGVTNFFDSLLKEFNPVILIIPLADISCKRYSIKILNKIIKGQVKINFISIAYVLCISISLISYFFIPNDTLNYHKFNRNPILHFFWSFIPQTDFKLAQTQPKGNIYLDAISPFRSESKQKSLDIAALPANSLASLNIVLILMESTGIKPTSLLTTKIMPNFWQLAEKGLYWDNFYAVVPLSIKSIFAVHSGYYPLPDMNPLTYSQIQLTEKPLPQYFKDRDYRTLLLHGGHFSYSNKLHYLNTCGYDQLFDAETIPEKERYETTSWGIDDQALYEYAKRWITQNTLQNKLRHNKPFLITFIPIHPHHPYSPPAHWPCQFPTNSKIDRFFNSVHYEDYLLGDFVSFLKENRLYDSTLFILLGDHGQAFGLHKGNQIHSSDIYEENLQVPLLISNPLLFSSSQKAATIGTVPDVLPTVLDIFNIRREKTNQPGISLLQPLEQRMIFFYSGHGGDKLGLRDGLFKFIYRRDLNYIQLFNLALDPDERNNIADQYPERIHFYKQKVLEWEKYANRTLLP
jgi:phosphoglycerol transferase MdoB-like AlkP superfamily enzyme